MGNHAAEAPQGPGTPPGRPPTPFVGRERELAELRAALDATEAGSRGLVLLFGDPGIGKTRIAAEITAEARDRGWATAVARCPEDNAGTPGYDTWVHALRELVKLSTDPDGSDAALGLQIGDLAGLVPGLGDAARQLERPLDVPESARFRLFEDVCRSLRALAEERPVLIVLEDLHGADDDSLQLLRFVVDAQVAERLLVVGTYRDADVDRDHPLSAIVAEVLRAPSTTSIPLKGFTESEVAILVERFTAEAPSAWLTTQIHRRTEGNPFFVTEVVRLLLSEADGTLNSGGAMCLEIPHGVREVVRKRLRRLSAASYETLEEAAVLGRDFDSILLERMSGENPLELLARLEEALRARIVHAVADAPCRLRFSHALVRDTIYEDTGARRRAELHRRAPSSAPRQSPHRAPAALRRDRP